MICVLVGCGGSETGSKLEVSHMEEGTRYRADWSYESFEVDVELTLTTFEKTDECSTTASLVINDVVSSEEAYTLEPTDCSVLRLTEGGDIVLESSLTDHDWSGEALKVDTERELVMLGPVTLDDPVSGESRAFRFTLAAPPCPDDDDCDCGVLQRLGGPETLSLALGRRCD